MEAYKVLIQRIEYQCNYASENSTFEDSKSSLGNTLIDAMKYYSIIDEPDEVYSSKVIAVLDATSVENEK